MNLSLTSSSGDADTLYGLNIGALTGGSATEYALNIGSGWDRAISAAGPSVFTFGASDTFTLEGRGGKFRRLALTDVERGHGGLYRGEDSGCYRQGHGH